MLIFTPALGGCTSLFDFLCTSFVCVSVCMCVCGWVAFFSPVWSHSDLNKGKCGWQFSGRCHFKDSKMLLSANNHFQGGVRGRKHQCIFRDVTSVRANNTWAPEALISVSITPHMSLELRGWIFKRIICISLDLMQLSLWFSKTELKGKYHKKKIYDYT